MIVKVEDLICYKGREWNEDYAYLCEDYAFVLDGASNITGEHYTSCNTDAEWYAQKFGKYLEVALKDKDKSIKEIMKQGIIEVTQNYIEIVGDKKIIDMPSSCVTAIRFDKNRRKMEYFVLGDSGIAMRFNNNIVNITDQVLPKLDGHDLRTMQDIVKEKGITVLEARRYIDKQMFQKRMLKNKPNGYWILGDDVEACEHAMYGVVDVANGGQVLLYTDGFSQIWETVNLYTLEQVFNKLKSGVNLLDLSGELYSIQENDPFCNKYPRFKKRDDTSAIYIEI